MKKIYLLLILSLQGLFLTAQTVSINLDEQNIADVLTPDVQKTVTKITLKGHMTSADYPFVNACQKLTKLDLTNAIVDSIPEHSLTNANILLDLYLPKKKTVFNANAIKNISGYESSIITVHVTGYFPTLNSLSSVLEGPYGPMQEPQTLCFTTDEGNNCCYEPYKGVIFSADKDTLFKFSPMERYDYRHGYYDTELKYLDDTAKVKVVAPYAFAYSKNGGNIYFTDSLKMICHNAFEGAFFPDLTTGLGGVQDGSLSIYLGNNPPQLELPVEDISQHVVYYNDWPYYLGYNDFTLKIPSFHTYLENSCLWAEAPISNANFDWMWEYNNNNRRFYTYRDSNNNVLYYEPPHVIKTEWYSETYNVENIEFTKTTEGTDSIISTDIEVEYGSYYMFIIAWKTIVDESGVSADWNPCHYVEYHDTIYSPIPDDDELDYDFEIHDDDGNLVFSSRRKGDKGSTEHLNGTLTNVPQSQQGDLKSRTSGMRYGASPWKSQRVNFGPTGIRPLDAAPANNTYYDLTGRPAEETSKGILIKNGKKVLVK